MISIFTTFCLSGERGSRRTVLELDRRICSFEDIKAIEKYIKENISENKNTCYKQDIKVINFQYLEKTTGKNLEIISGKENLKHKKGNGNC